LRKINFEINDHKEFDDDAEFNFILDYKRRLTALFKGNLSSDHIDDKRFYSI
jgi:hypothetical protein